MRTAAAAGHGGDPLGGKWVGSRPPAGSYRCHPESGVVALALRRPEQRRSGLPGAKCGARCEMRRAPDRPDRAVSGCDIGAPPPRTGRRLVEGAVSQGRDWFSDLLPAAVGPPPPRLGFDHPGLARQMLCSPVPGNSGPRQTPSPYTKAGVSDFIRACGRLAPDPHSHGRTLLPGRRPQPACLERRLDSRPGAALLLRFGCLLAGPRFRAPAGWLSHPPA
jgi:hypothetical protein